MILTGRPTYDSSLKTVRNTYGVKIKPVEFSKSLGGGKQFLEQQYKKEGDGKHPVQINADGTDGLRMTGNFPVEEHIPE